MILILNHKANLNYKKILEYEKKLRKYNVVVMPQMCYLSLFSKGKYILASQDISEFSKTNITGEINGASLKSIGVKYSLVGHSDRIIYKKENQEIIKNKINEAINNGIIPLLCIGENTINNNEQLVRQIDYYLSNITKNIYIVYEPIYNIGKKDPVLDCLEEKIAFIKNYIKEKYNIDIKLIYGGGVNITNIDIIKSIKDIDGVIVSTDSLNIEDVKLLVDKTKK